MLDMTWLDDLGSLERAIELANQFYWNISVRQGGRTWSVFAGEKRLLTTDNREAVDAFLYGFGVAYSVLPDHLVQQFRAELNIEE